MVMSTYPRSADTAYWDDLLIRGRGVGQQLVTPHAANHYGIVSLHTEDGHQIYWGTIHQGICDILSKHHPTQKFFVMTVSRLYRGDIHPDHLTKWHLATIQGGVFYPRTDCGQEALYGPCQLSAGNARFRALQEGDTLLYISASPAFPLCAWIKITRVQADGRDSVYVTPIQVYTSSTRITLPKNKASSKERFEVRNFPALATELYA